MLSKFKFLLRICLALFLAFFFNGWFLSRNSTSSRKMAFVLSGSLRSFLRTAGALRMGMGIFGADKNSLLSPTYLIPRAIIFQMELFILFTCYTFTHTHTHTPSSTQPKHHKHNSFTLLLFFYNFFSFSKWLPVLRACSKFAVGTTTKKTTPIVAVKRLKIDDVENFQLKRQTFITKSL